MPGSSREPGSRGSPRTWEGLDEGGAALAWQVPRVELHSSISSTSDRARQLLMEGARPFTVIVADEQTAGRGRSGRHWSSPPGKGLWMSVVLRPPSTAHQSLIPLLSALAAARALEAEAPGARVEIKWPNDLLLEGKKVAGVLSERVGGSGGGVTVGIGVNLLQEPGEFPPEIRDQATSLAPYAGEAPVQRARVAGRILSELRTLVRAWPSTLEPRLLREVADRDALAGRDVRVTGPAAVQGRAPDPLTGRCTGIRAEGTLGIEWEDEDGVRRCALTAGTVRPAGPAPESARTAEKR